jgi:23S rRNA (guanosine2251-2'-O)-methyltransferase
MMITQKKNRHNAKNNISNYPDNKGKDGSLWICGKHPVFTILLKARRKIFTIFVTNSSKIILQEFLAKNNLLAKYQSLIKLTDNDHLRQLAGDEIHQGLAINCSYLKLSSQNDFLTEIYDLKSKFSNESKQPTLPAILIMDQLKDPHNIGAIIRSAVAFGVTKVVFLEHNFPKESAVMSKSSSGMIEFVDLILISSLNNFIEKLKAVGYWCIGLDGAGSTLISEIIDYQNIALIIGSEGDGMRQLVKKNCDIVAKINLSKEVESLNASAAASIALYQLFGKKL